MVEVRSIHTGVSQMSPLVTAVLVCWNHECFVEQAVESVVQQTYKNIELVVFDNGSIDNSAAILRRMQQRYGFKLILQENIGLVKTLNRALSMSNGEFFAVLATDDAWLPDKTARQIEFFSTHPEIDLTFGATQTIDTHGSVIENAGRKKIYSGEVRFDDLLAYSGSTSGPTVMCRINSLRAVGGYDEDLRIEDASLVYKLTKNGFRVYGMNEVLTLYRRHGGNWTMTQPIWPDICAIGRKYCRSDEEYKNFVRRCLRLEFRRLAGTDRLQALKLLRTQPIAWTMDDVGAGLLKMLVPRIFINYRRSSAGQ